MFDWRRWSTPRFAQGILATTDERDRPSFLHKPDGGRTAHAAAGAVTTAIFA